MERYTTLLEQQSYRDALDYYLSTLDNETLQVWDYVILTASNEAQAKSYELQISHRLEQDWLPKRTHYAVIPDLNGQRIGSGGATLSCIKYVAEREQTLEGKRILVIHSGGDSKRVPQYSACGKLFSPVPRLLQGKRRSTLFDELMIGMSMVAGRIREGMLVCSGDVLLLFNALQIDFYGADAAALSIKEHVNTGKNHGVYLKDSEGNVGHFLHKQTEESLKNAGAVDESQKVDIDTGAVILNSTILESLYQLVNTEEKYHQFVNEKARLSFYADFLYPLATESTLEQFYMETPEGDYTEELRVCRGELWRVLADYSMKLMCLTPASFIHFGTTHELLHLMTAGMEQFRFLDWSSAINSNLQPEEYAVSNSYVSKRAAVGDGSYIEDSRIHCDSIVGEGCVISGVTLNGDVVPNETVLHGLKLEDGRFVCRMYGVHDNPKESKWIGQNLSKNLWEEKLFPICDSMEEAVARTLAGDRNGELISLQESFASADVTAILPWQENLYEQVVAEAILEQIDNGVSAEKVREQYPNIHRHTVKYLVDKAEKQELCQLDNFSRRIRIYGYLWDLTGDRHYRDLCFQSIGDAIIMASLGQDPYDEASRIKKDVVVNLPVRVNWGGGWSDTPPYCMEHGGTVLNAAVSLNGQLPIEVTVKKLEQPIVILESTDIGSYGEFTQVEDLLACKNPSDPFALHKAGLIACGLIPRQGDVSVKDLCDRLGGGIYINTRVIDIPKGSGLGTSSILAGACAKALLQAVGKNPTDHEIFKRVLCMEQLMSTGGGWQDQVGGIVPGVKLINTKPGLVQEITCTPIRISQDTMEELNQRFALIYTGQRRLARNLLREVVGKYICNDEPTVKAHARIQELAKDMCAELERGNVDAFAGLLSEHWVESQRIDAGCTNACIDLIFETVDDLIDGKMICGAGGGGFLQVVLKKHATKDMLRTRLKEVFRDSGIDVWDCTFI